MENQIKLLLEELINKTFRALHEVYQTTPKTRINEQELRTIFVEQFNKIANANELYPSVSNELDIIVFDQMGNNISLIEFRAHGKAEYFVLLIDSCNDSTIKSCEEKIAEFKEIAPVKCFALTSDSSDVITL